MMKKITTCKKLSNGAEFEIVLKMRPSENGREVSDDVIQAEVVEMLKGLLFSLIGELTGYNLSD